MSDVLVGTMDWRHEQWVEGFYPADLPEDWRLSYYANEYATTVIDLAEFDAAGREELLDQLSDCHEAFHPILKVQIPRLTIDEVMLFLDALDGQDKSSEFSRLAGIWLDGETFTQMEALQQWRQGINPTYPVAASIDPDLYVKNRQALLADKISLVGHITETQNAVEQPWLVLVSLKLPARELAAQLTLLFEKKGPSAGITCLIAVDGFSDTEKLEEIFTIVELLGA